MTPGLKPRALIRSSGPDCSKRDQANPGLARILISDFQLFGEMFCLYCLPFSFEL